MKDAGGSLVVHAFGAYFGIAVAIGMGVKAKQLPADHRTTTYFRYIKTSRIFNNTWYRDISDTFCNNFSECKLSEFFALLLTGQRILEKFPEKDSLHNLHNDIMTF